MAEALITFVAEQFRSHAWEALKQEVKLAAGVNKDVEELTRTLATLQVLLRDAEMKQVTDPGVRSWLKALKDIAYDADDVVDEWCTRLQLSKLNPDDAAGMIDAIIHNPDTPGMIKNVFYYVFTPCFHYLPSCISCCVPDVFRHHHQIAHHIQDIKERLITHHIQDIKERLDRVARDSICDRLKKIPVQQIPHQIEEKIMDSTVHILAGQSDQDCWLLFRDIAFGGRSEKECEKFEEIGKQIVKKCEGVSLAIKTVAGVVRHKRTKIEWRKVLENDIWNIQQRAGGFLLPSLLLSYDDLPPHLKQCFLYCAIFPMYKLIEKDVLVKLWMSQGYLGLDGDEDLEMIGGEYFDDLAMRLLFEGFIKDSEGNIIKCRMHPLVHDFVQFLTKTECAILGMNATRSNNNAKLRHINVGDSKYLENPSGFDMKKLRTLMLREHDPVIFRKLFSQLTCVRSLVLRLDNIKELPDEIGSLLHLRYLKLYCSALTELPETMCNLYNLQTLKLKKCDRLRKLPEGFGRLLNLRHLECKGGRLERLFNLSHPECNAADNLEYFPQGFGKLKHLRTLTTFGVSKASGGCKLEELGDLNLIGGDLEIWGLHQEGSIDEAKQAELQKKENLVSLTLRFNDMDQRNIARVEGILNQRNTTTVEEILEGLQPPCYLKKLTIDCYRGLAFPNWMSKLSNIVNLVLYRCQKCTQLPALGTLPCLETLVVKCCFSIKQVGVEFLGLPEPESHRQTTFPKLTNLELNKLTEWEEWDLPLSLFTSQYEIFPCLVQLTISECRKLKALPALISKLPSLEVFYLEDMSCTNDVFGISEHCGFVNRESISSSSVPLFPELTTLALRRMDNWEEEIHQITTASSTISPLIMPNLRCLFISLCPNLTVIPNYLLSCNLRKLQLAQCPRLIARMDPYNLQLLESLELWDDVGVFSTSLAQLININTIQNLKSINLYRLPCFSLPQGINHFRSLQKLVIRYCNLIDFNPEEELNSKHFPKLQELSIGECDLMTKRCSTVNWSNLFQISQISVDYNRIRV